MHNFLALTSALFIFFTPFSHLKAERPIRIVGSTAVYTFVTMAAERLGRTTDVRTPIVEATGTGGGIKIFCGGTGKNYPEIVSTSRQISDQERKQCKINGIEDILEIKIGYDGIVIGAHPTQKPFSLTRKELSMALSEYVQTKNGWVKNPYRTWDEINSAFPQIKISVLGPTSTLATREVFEEKVIKDGCKQNPEATKCSGNIREDGVFIEVAEHENVVIQKLELKPQSIGFVSFGYYSQNPGKIKPFCIDGIFPTLETIGNNSYPLSRPLFLYIKKNQFAERKAIGAFLNELFSEQAAGPNGYLIDKGLIPLSSEEQKAIIESISNEESKP